MHIHEFNGKLLLKNGTILDPFNNQEYKSDILFEKGVIAEIGENLSEAGMDKVLDASKMYVSPGFVDIHVHFREPGNEIAETLESGAKAALAGGFTKVCTMPNTSPCVDNEAEVLAVYRKTAHLPTDVYPIAAITQGREGKVITEMAILKRAGAVGFSDDGTPLANGQILRNALEYSQITGNAIINHAEDPELRGNGIMNEGLASTQTGLPGNPSIAEETMINRDIEVARFTGGRLHVPHVSTAGSVDLIRRAKATGVHITAEVTPHHLSLTDEYMKTFDANGKVAPPLRTENDRKALIAGLKDGTIDAIATDHAPHVIDVKETTLDLASFGMIGLESAFGLIMTKLYHEEQMPLLDIIKKLTINPAKIMNLTLPEFKVGEKANVTVFSADEWWVFSRKNVESRSHNSPFFGTEMTGKAKLIVKDNFIVNC
ncbi:MAG: dihydroorotase [Candidatus Marinimicrobia bacterium]|nr:dihydroorotase [Candidatus Neomarinimicrobiota bacterium]